MCQCIPTVLLARCHVKLLELFDRKQLPPFPPKEPLCPSSCSATKILSNAGSLSQEPFWQKVFGGDDARSDWMEERYGKLFGPPHG